MSDKPEFSRRTFLRAIGMSTAGLALGGGAAWAYTQVLDQQAAEAALQQLTAQVSAAQQQSVSLDATVGALQGQITTLNAELAAATSQNAELANALASAQKTAMDAHTHAAETTNRLTAAEAKLTVAEAKLTQYQTLIGLFDQLEAIGLDGLTREGLSAAAAGLSQALGLSPLVQSGLKLANGLLDEFEKTLPDFTAGLAWLGERVVRLKASLLLLEKAAKVTVAQAATGVVAIFGGFIKFVMDYLPFDIGEQTRATFSAAQTLITHTAEVSTQAEAEVLSKMTRYVGDGPANWRRQLVTPLRTQAMPPADQLVTAVTTANAQFTQKLQTPVQAALDKRAALKTLIAEHRAKHQL